MYLLRDIIDNGLKPAIQDIMTIIIASVTDIFGNYAVDFLFIMGNIFNLPQDSPIYTAHTIMLQEAFESSIQLTTIIL